MKLPLTKILKLAKEAFFEGENSYPAIAIGIAVVFGLFMSCSVPSFMSNGFANFVMHLIIAALFIVALVGCTIAIGTFIEDETIPWFNKVKDEYNKRADVEKKKLIEQVDDILLK